MCVQMSMHQWIREVVVLLIASVFSKKWEAGHQQTMKDVGDPEMREKRNETIPCLSGGMT